MNPTFSSGLSGPRPPPARACPRRGTDPPLATFVSLRPRRVDSSGNLKDPNTSGLASAFQSGYVSVHVNSLTSAEEAQKNMRPRTSKWLFTVMFGLLIGSAYTAIRTVTPATAQVQLWCDDTQCIEVCFAGDCTSGCSNFPNWDCAGPPFGDPGPHCASVRCISTPH